MIIPQSVCSIHGLAICASVAPVVRILVWICFPVAYPISKAGKGGELAHDETTIIAGTLELSDKTSGDAMTPISETFAIDINGKLDSIGVSELFSQGVVAWLRIDPNFMHYVDFFPRSDGLVERNCH